MAEQPLHVGKQQRARVVQTQTPRHLAPFDLHALDLLPHALERAQDQLVARLGGVDGHEQRSGLVRGAHELESGLGAQVVHEQGGLPRRERVEPRKRLDVAVRIGEGELGAQAHELAQDVVGQARGGRRHGLHELHALVDGGVEALVEEKYLIGRYAQRVAHLGAHVVGIIQHAVDDLVEGARRADHPEHEARGERAVLGREGRVVDVPRDDVLGVRLALADLAQGGQRREARGGRLRAQGPRAVGTARVAGRRARAGRIGAGGAALAAARGLGVRRGGGVAVRGFRREAGRALAVALETLEPRAVVAALGLSALAAAPPDGPLAVAARLRAALSVPASARRAGALAAGTRAARARGSLAFAAGARACAVAAKASGSPALAAGARAALALAAGRVRAPSTSARGALALATARAARAAVLGTPVVASLLRHVVPPRSGFRL